MKSKIFGLLTLFAVLLFSLSVLAQATPAPISIPSWVTVLIGLIGGIPYIGPILLFIGKWGGLIAGMFTALSLAVQSVLKVPELIAIWSGAQGAADKIKAFSDMILPYLQYLSIFNVQKSLSKK